MIYVAMKIKRDGGKQSPVAVGVYTDREMADEKVNELISSGIKKDDAWVDTSTCDDAEWWRTNVGVGETVYPVWAIESKRPVSGLIDTVQASKERAEMYIDEEMQNKERCSWLKGFLILECEFKG